MINYLSYYSSAEVIPVRDIKLRLNDESCHRRTILKSATGRSLRESRESTRDTKRPVIPIMIYPMNMCPLAADSRRESCCRLLPVKLPVSRT